MKHVAKKYLVFSVAIFGSSLSYGVIEHIGAPEPTHIKNLKEGTMEHRDVTERRMSHVIERMGKIGEHVKDINAVHNLREVGGRAQLPDNASDMVRAATSGVSLEIGEGRSLDAVQQEIHNNLSTLHDADYDNTVNRHNKELSDLKSAKPSIKLEEGEQVEAQEQFKSQLEQFNDRTISLKSEDPEKQLSETELNVLNKTFEKVIGKKLSELTPQEFNTYIKPVIKYMDEYENYNKMMTEYPMTLD